MSQTQERSIVRIFNNTLLRRSLDWVLADKRTSMQSSDNQSLSAIRESIDFSSCLSGYRLCQRGDLKFQDTKNWPWEQQVCTYKKYANWERKISTQTKKHKTFFAHFCFGSNDDPPTAHGMNFDPIGWQTISDHFSTYLRRFKSNLVAKSKNFLLEVFFLLRFYHEYFFHRELGSLACFAWNWLDWATLCGRASVQDYK